MTNGKGSGEFSQLGWAKWKGEVSSDLSSVTADVKEIFKLVRQVREELAFMKGKAAAYGAIAGTITSVIAAAIQMWIKTKGS